MAPLKSKAYLWWLAITASLGGLLFGYDTAVISGTLSMVRGQFELSAALEGWYVSSALLGCIAGVSAAGWLSDRYGRKMMLLLSALLFSVSALGCALSGSFAGLVVFRLVGGMGVGIASMLAPLYISEISPASLRGRFVAIYQLAITAGILVSYLVNAWLLEQSAGPSEFHSERMAHVFKTEVWRAMLGMESIPAIAFLLLLIFVPESPRWLMATGRQQRALEIFRRAGGEAAARRELEEIGQTLKKEKETKRLMWTPGIRLALFLGVSLAVLQQFTGIDAIIYYGPRIMESAGFALHDALGSQVLIGTVNMVFTLLAIWKIDQFGRRRLLISGTSGMLVSLLAIGSLFLLGRAEGTLLLMFILLFIASFAFSLGPVVWVILSEIYPTSIRGRAMSIATMAVWIGTATIGQLIPLSLDRLGPAITFWIFALFCIPTIWIGWKMLPETKGKSLEEIERHWMERGSSGGGGAVR